MYATCTVEGQSWHCWGVAKAGRGYQPSSGKARHDSVLLIGLFNIEYLCVRSLGLYIVVKLVQVVCLFVVLSI